MVFDIKELNGLKSYYLILVIVLASFIIRMFLRSNYLDDWDSVQFVLGLNNYSIIAHQPHPPGYPVYIFIGRIVDQFFNCGLESFTFMSSLFGSLALIPTFLLAKEFFGYRAGILSAIILSFAPSEMLFSEVVMSDIVSMFFITATVYFFYMGIRSSNYTYIGSIILAATIGIRQTNFPLILLLFLISIYKRNMRELAVSLGILSVGIALWLVPTVMDTGFSNFIVAQNTQGKTAFEYATFSELNEANFMGLLITIKRLISLFAEGWSSALFVFCLVSVVAIIGEMGNFKKGIADRRVLLLIIWMLPYFILFIFLYQLYITRYLLPVFPPMAIIFGYSLIKLVDNIKIKSIRKFFIIFIILIISSMGIHAISAAHALHTSEPAPVSGAKLIKELYNPNTTVVLAYESFRHFQYYLPEFSVISSPSLSEIIGYLAENKTIIIEGAPPLNNIYKSYTFYRDPKIYSKHARVGLYELNKNSKNIFLADGWYGYENLNNISTCWMSGNATILITSPENCIDILSLNPVSFYRNRTLEIYSGDKLIKRLSVPASFLNVSVPVTLKEGLNILRFHVPEGCERPCDRELNSPDSRCLSVAFQNVTLS